MAGWQPRQDGALQEDPEIVEIINVIKSMNQREWKALIRNVLDDRERKILKGRRPKDNRTTLKELG